MRGRRRRRGGSVMSTFAALRGQEEDKEIGISDKQAKARSSRQSSEHGSLCPRRNVAKNKTKACRGLDQKTFTRWNHFTRWKCCAWASALSITLPLLAADQPVTHSHARSAPYDDTIPNMTTRRIVKDDKSTLDYDGRGPPGPSNISPAVPS